MLNFFKQRAAFQHESSTSPLAISRLFVKGVNIDMHATNAKKKQSYASILQLFSIKYLLLQPLESIFMGMSTIAKNFRIDSELNRQANKLLEGLGLSMSQAFSMFLRQVVLQQGLPFEVKYPRRSGELLNAIEEAKRLEADPNTKRYTDMDEMWADLDK